MPIRARPVACEQIESRTLLSGGTLDPFFGTNGITTVQFPEGSAVMDDLQFLPGGKILGVGVWTTSSGSRLVLARFLSDGRPDLSFGDGTTAPAGVVDPDVAGITGRIKLLTKGKILFAGGSRVIRFNADGSVDPTFTQDEPSRYKFNFNTLAIEVQADGKILLSGRYKNTLAKNGHFAVARLNPNGTRDRSFGIGGVADFWQHTNSSASDVRAMSDGKIYVSGGINHGYPNDIDEFTVQEAIVRRLNPDGSPDLTFDGDGVASRTARFFAGAAITSALADDGTATIVMASEFGGAYRFTPEGQFDTSFGSNGAASMPARDVSELRACVQSDGALLGVFRHYNYTGPNIPTLMRLTPSGTTDISFGTDGSATMNSNADFRRAGIANDGSILVAGQTGSDMLLARYWRDDAPAVQLNAKNLKEPIEQSYRFNLSVRDAVAVKAASIDSSDFRIFTPDGSSLRPTLMSLDTRHGAKLIGANLKFAPPGGTWGPEDNGAYQVRLLSNHIFDTDGNASGGRIIGTFWVSIA